MIGKKVKQNMTQSGEKEVFFKLIFLLNMVKEDS